MNRADEFRSTPDGVKRPLVNNSPSPRPKRESKKTTDSLDVSSEKAQDKMQEHPSAEVNPDVKDIHSTEPLATGYEELRMLLACPR